MNGVWTQTWVFPVAWRTPDSGRCDICCGVRWRTRSLWRVRTASEYSTRLFRLGKPWISLKHQWIGSKTPSDPFRKPTEYKKMKQKHTQKKSGKCRSNRKVFWVFKLYFSKQLYFIKFLFYHFEVICDSIHTYVPVLRIIFSVEKSSISAVQSKCAHRKAVTCADLAVGAFP